MAEQISETKKIADEICSNRAEYEQKIRELFTKMEICGIDEFYKNYQKEIIDINSEITPSKDDLTISNFKEIFQTFERYPSNLQKQRKVASKDLSRNLSKTTLCSEISMMCPVTPQTTNYEQGPTAAEIYSGFREFRKSLKKLAQELKQTEFDKDYMKKLQKLISFAKDIEKLCGTDSLNIQQAFTEEAATLKQLVENLEKAIFINNNRNLFKEINVDQQYSSQNHESLLELLTFWYNSVAHYKEM